MKRSITLGIIGWFIATLGSIKATAQDAPVPPPPPPAPPAAMHQKESQEIVIRKKGDKDTKLTLEIADGKVTINGKPLAEFNEDGVTINNRKMIVRDGDKITMNFDGKMMDLDSKLADLDHLKDLNFKFNDDDIAWTGDTKEYTYLGVSTTKADEGVKVTGVTKDSPADKAGIEKDDIIYKIDDTKIDGTSLLSETIRAKKDGEKVKVYYMRDGKKKDVKATLSTTKSVTTRSFTYTGPDGIKSLTLPRAQGMPKAYGNGSYQFDDVQLFRRQKLGLKIQDTEEGTGVKVLDVEAASAAATAGLMKDDVITEIGGVKVTNTDEARAQLQENKDKSTYAVKAKRNGSEMNFTVKIPKNLKTANL